jgi:dipeptidyl aminopeptidase/acylaminoacyl peptidase
MRALFCLLLLAAPGTIHAAPAPDRTIAALLALPTASWLVGAPARPRFAWVENRAGVRNVLVADKGRPARALTGYRDDDGQDLYDLTFDPAGTRLAYVRGGDGEYPDGTPPNPAHAAVAPRQSLHLLDADNGADRVLGEGHAPAFAPDGSRIAWAAGGALWIAPVDGTGRKVATVPGAIADLSWSPDGTRLLFRNDRGDHDVVALFEIATATLTYPDPGLRHDVEPVFSPDGTRIAFIRFASPPADAASDSGPYWSIRTVDLRSGAASTLWAAPAGPGNRYAGTRGRNLFWAADGSLIFPWEATGWLHVYSLAPGAAAPRALTQGNYEVESFLLDPAGRNLLYTANDGDPDRRHVWRRAISGGPAISLTKGTGIETLPAPAGTEVAVIATDVTHPAYPALAGKNGALTPLAERPAVPGFVLPGDISFPAGDGLIIHGQYFRAPGPGRHPALIFLHGGPRRQMLRGFHPSRYYSNAWIFNQLMAAKGYDVLVVNYRGGTGYGLAFRDALETGRDGASEYRDVRAAGLYLAARPDIDSARIGLWGGSWGGYLTALGLARDSVLFAAGVDLHGVHNLLRAPAAGLSPDAQDAARRLQWASSPLGALDRWRSPVLLIHGDDDRNVDSSQSVLLASLLAARGIPHEEMLLPDERHSFLRYESWVRAYDAAMRFLDRSLAPSRQGPSMKGKTILPADPTLPSVRLPAGAR